MSMVIAHNMAAINTLNQLARNDKNLAKALGHVSSGQKINNAGDDASGYSISEKMRVQIRGLDQANRNAQNGQSALKVAEGALNEIESLVRTMKERAINAANDTNTDEDRAIIQKELDQYKDQIDDIAIQTSFNGMKLLDGSFGIRSNMDNTTEGLILRGLNTWWIEQSLDSLEEAYGMTFREEGGARKMKVTLYNTPGDNTLASVNSTNFVDGFAQSFELKVNKAYFSSLSSNDTNGNGTGSGLYLDRTIAHEMTHAIQRGLIGINATGFETWFTEGMAEYTHGGDSRILSTPGGATDFIDSVQTNSGTPTQRVYAGGYMAVRYIEEQLGHGSMKKLVQYMHEQTDLSGAPDFDIAISAVSNGRFAGKQGLVNSMRADLAAAGSDDAFYRRYCGIDLTNADTGSILGTDAAARSGRGLNDEDVIDEGGGTYGKMPTGTSRIRGLTVEWPNIGQALYGGMVIQADTKANRGIIFDLEKMDSGQLGIRNLDVRTQFSASRAISMLDRAVERITDQATLIGSYLSRLDFTQANIVTASESTTGAESIIRDADMAAKMTEYTKYNVLSQASQAMLAQANQNSSNVLSLLQ